jgi:hypothetical protein
MNKIVACILSISCLAAFTAFQAADGPACDSKNLKDKAKKTLDPYKYDSAKLTKIAYKTKESVKEVEVPLFIGEKYRFVFNTETISKTVVINIYNKDKDSKNRKLLFSTQDAPTAEKEHVWEHTHAMKVFVDYSIPPADSTAAAGCVLFMLGYQ